MTPLPGHDDLFVVSSKKKNPLKFNFDKRFVIFIICAIVLIVVSLVISQFLTGSKKKVVQQEKPRSEITPMITLKDYTRYKAEEPIMTVGQETIYKKDLDNELASSPNGDLLTLQETLIKKLITDSTVLQGAQSDGYITLNQAVFNSPNKDYSKRIKLVEEARNKVISQADHLKGTIISIWFYNTQAGSVGYEEGKRIAYEKISLLQVKVKSGQMTIEEAGQRIKNDNSLVKVDSAYKTNAQHDFEVNFSQPISFDPRLDKILWSTEAGEVSEIITSQDKDRGGKMIDAVYSFAKIKSKSMNQTLKNFDQWLQTKKKEYAVKYL